MTSTFIGGGATKWILLKDAGTTVGKDGGRRGAGLMPSKLKLSSGLSMPPGRWDSTQVWKDWLEQLRKNPHQDFMDVKNNIRHAEEELAKRALKERADESGAG